MATKTKTSLMPTSKAKTAYALLSEVRTLILEEPKRYNQGIWLRRGRSKSFPSCGTVGCVAGWVASLKTPNVKPSEVMATAQAILGLDSLQANHLFDGSAVDGLSQSVEHAADGAAHIRAFQAGHAAQLKRTRV